MTLNYIVYAVMTLNYYCYHLFCRTSFVIREKMFDTKTFILFSFLIII